MMKLTATAALGALILAASAAPAMAGGYWDGGIVQSGQGDDAQPAYSNGGCPCYCPSDRGDRDHGWREEQRWGDRDGGRSYNDDREQGNTRYYSDEQVYDSGWRDQSDYQDQDEDSAPAEYSDSGYGVGPVGYYDEAGGGGGGGGGGFAGAGAFVGADAFANANVDVDVDVRDRFRDHFHDHDMHHDHHMQPYPPRMMQHNDHPYPQHQAYQPRMMQPYRPMQPHYAMAPRMPVYSHPMMMHRSGGGRRW